LLLCLVTLTASCVSTTNMPSILELQISSFLCSDENSFNPIALFLLEDPQLSIRSLFTAPADTIGFGIGYLAIAFAASLIGLGVMCGLPVPAGQFIPLVLTGSLFGRIIGTVFRADSPGVYAIAGAGALLAGVSRMTVWIAVVMIESSAQIELTIPVVLAIVSAKLVADWLMPHALYERIIEEKGIRYLNPSDDVIVIKKFSEKKVRHIMTTSVVVLYETESIDRIQTVLNRTTYQLFPVLSHHGYVLGTVSRASLESLKADSLDQVTLTRNGAVTVSESASALRAYHLFTHLGLGILIVTDDSNRLSGIITRENLVS